jgi:HEAT repeat protein
VFRSKVKRAAAARDVEALLRFLTSDRPKDRAAAANSFVMVDPGPARERVVRGLFLAAQDADENVRGQAVFALGEMRALEARERFLGALGDPDWSVRVFGGVAVSRVEDGRAVPRLQELLHDAMWLVRQQAAWSLGELADPDDVRSMDLLTKAGSSDHDKDVRNAALEALDTLRARNRA